FNSSGTMTGQASYDAYGNVIAGGLSNITPFGYAGGYTDPTGLVYLINRYYDPSTGQFVSVDPLVSLTNQPYQYVGGDPVNQVDPLGLMCLDALDPFSSGFGQCWSSGYKRAGHFVATHTLGVCLNGEAGAGPAAFGSLCLGFAGGHFFTMETAGGGGGAPNAGISLGLLFSNATNPHQLAGPFAAVGSSADPFDQGLSVGADGAYGTGPCNSGIWEGQPEVGISLDNPFLPFETHGGVSQTWIQEP
ncbi:MAG: RHS repeat-associated core domain-containing protein, partial [Acidimicrobiales bacterium]